MQKRTSSRHLLRLGAVLVLGAIAACGASVDDTLRGSETHFLTRCEDECGGGLECIAGVCTRACVDDGECTVLHAAARCSAASAGLESGRCEVACSSGAECRAQDEAWTCFAASCVAPSLLSVSLPPLAAAAECPSFSDGVQEPIDIEATATALSVATYAQSVHADASGLYWRDGDEVVYGLRRGDATAVALTTAPSEGFDGVILDGDLTGDDERLYWVQELVPSESLSLRFGRVVAVPKSGGAPQLVAETDRVLAMVAGFDAVGNALVVTEGGSLERVTPAGTFERIENVPLPVRDVQVADGRVYWVEEGAERRELFSAIPGVGTPERIAAIDGQYAAGRGVVLWVENVRTQPEPLVQRLVLRDLRTGCERALPYLEGFIDQPRVDGLHVYWFGHGLALWASLLRVDLESGRFERIGTPDPRFNVGALLGAQNEEALYLDLPGQGLLAVRKP